MDLKADGSWLSRPRKKYSPVRAKNLLGKLVRLFDFGAEPALMVA